MKEKYDIFHIKIAEINSLINNNFNFNSMFIEPMACKTRNRY